VEFSDIITSKKKAKQEAISDLAQQYADFLTQVVRQYPYQWFNFFDFWEKRP
jgi:predicted LPLAT superfamily acyltransferase